MKAIANMTRHADQERRACKWDDYQAVDGQAAWQKQARGGARTGRSPG
jgi:hypothetical protein